MTLLLKCLIHHVCKCVTYCVPSKLPGTLEFISFVTLIYIYIYMQFQLPQEKGEPSHNDRKCRKKRAKKRRKPATVKVFFRKGKQKCPLCPVLTSSDIRLIEHFAEEHHGVRDSQVTQSNDSTLLRRLRKRKCIPIRHDKYSHRKVTDASSYIWGFLVLPDCSMSLYLLINS